MLLGNSERVSELVKNLDVNKRNDVGDTALIRASESGIWFEIAIIFMKFQMFYWNSPLSRSLRDSRFSDKAWSQCYTF